MRLSVLLGGWGRLKSPGLTPVFIATVSPAIAVITAVCAIFIFPAFAVLLPYAQVCASSLLRIIHLAISTTFHPTSLIAHTPLRWSPV